MKPTPISKRSLPQAYARPSPATREYAVLRHAFTQSSASAQEHFSRVEGVEVFDQSVRQYSLYAICYDHRFQLKVAALCGRVVKAAQQHGVAAKYCDIC